MGRFWSYCRYYLGRVLMPLGFLYGLGVSILSQWLYGLWYGEPKPRKRDNP